MKKITAIVIMCCMLLAMYIPNIALAADITVNVNFDNSTKKVIISGNISTGSGKTVTVKVLNPTNQINYFDQETSASDGSYSFSYILTDIQIGTYTVQVSGNDVENPATAQFINQATDTNNSSDDTATPVNTPSTPVVTPPVVTPGSGSTQPVTSVDNATGIVSFTISKDSLEKTFSDVVADEKGIKTASVEIAPVDNATAYSVNIPVDEVTFDDFSRKIKVVTEHSTLEIPNNMLQRSEFSGDNELTIDVKPVEKAQLSAELKEKIGDRPVVDISASIDGNAIDWNNTDAAVFVSIPYIPTAQELNNPEHIVVWYIDKAGKATPVPSAKYNKAEGVVTFKTTHFSMYTVAYVEKTFNDLKDYSWASNQISVLASKGIIEGTSADSFSPEQNITRADFLMLLVKTLGLDAKFDSNFTDVDKNAYYYKALGTAKKLGITTGVGNNMFNPDEQISRQDMMVLCERALKAQKIIKTTNSVTELDKFSDKNQVADYAQQSIASMVKEGIITGDGSTLSPLDNATRAEIAVIMYRIYNKQ